MRDFELLQPTTVAEASTMLADWGEDCRAMAGGTALMLVMRQRMVSPSHLIWLNGIEALRGIRFDPALGLRIGALSLHSEIARSPLVQAHCPMLASMAARVANPQVRNQGTLGGNLCYGDPSTDPPSCLMALGAQVVLASVRGERVLSMEEFLVDYFVTALAPDELVLEVRVPPAPDHQQGLYTRFKRTAAEHRPLASVALVVQRQGLQCLQASLVVGASVPVPRRLARAEQLLCSRPVSLELAAEAAALVAADIEPISDLRGSDSYRREMVRVNAQRSIEALVGLSPQERMQP